MHVYSHETEGYTHYPGPYMQGQGHVKVNESDIQQGQGH